MKILGVTWPIYLQPLRVQCPSLSLRIHLYQSVDASSSLASPVFSQTKQQNQNQNQQQQQKKKQQEPSDTMATCVETSRADAAGQVSRLSRDPNNDRKYSYQNFRRPNPSETFSSLPISQNHSKRHPDPAIDEADEETHTGDLWVKMVEEAESDVKQEPILSIYYHGSILSQTSLESALANHLSVKLSNSTLPSGTLLELFRGVLSEDEEIMRAVREDLRAVKQRDPACVSYVHCFLNFKGFLACQAHRVAHRLWSQGRKILALLIQNRVSEVFAVDIHPGAKIGCGILLDHATGFVVGETAVIGNNVSILHNVTLGGTGKASGDRHPKIGDGVLIGAGTCILGNIRIGDGAKIGAGSVVLKEVPPSTTAVGNPARLIGGKANPVKLHKMPSFTMDHTSHIYEWSDYVI